VLLFTSDGKEGSFLSRAGGEKGEEKIDLDYKCGLRSYRSESEEGRAKRTVLKLIFSPGKERGGGSFEWDRSSMKIEGEKGGGWFAYHFFSQEGKEEKGFAFTTPRRARLIRRV